MICHPSVGGIGIKFIIPVIKESIPKNNNINKVNPVTLFKNIIVKISFENKVKNIP